MSDYKSYRFVLEVRDTSWFTGESLALMKEYGIGFVISHSGGKFPFKESITSLDIYFRFHDPTAPYASNYNDAMLKKYARKFVNWIGEGHRIWAYFNNDGGGYAFRNALTLHEYISKLISVK